MREQSISQPGSAEGAVDGPHRCGRRAASSRFPVLGLVADIGRKCSPMQAEDELPERLIGSCRFEHLDLKSAAYLDDETGKIYKNDKMQ